MLSVFTDQPAFSTKLYKQLSVLKVTPTLYCLYIGYAISLSPPQMLCDCPSSVITHFPNLQCTLTLSGICWFPELSLASDTYSNFT